MVDPVDLVALDGLAALLGAAVTIAPSLATEAAIAAALDVAYGDQGVVDGHLKALQAVSLATGPTASASVAGHPGVVLLVDAVIAEAVGRGASDIHLEPEAGYFRIRLRLDGVLRTLYSVDRDLWFAVANRVKVLAAMDIAESRAVQEGRFSIRQYGRAVDLRVSTVPTLHGENLVLRVLDREKGFLSLAELGLTEEEREGLRALVAQPTGMLLICGPTGSGKTTTLYSLIDHLNCDGVNIMTLEDPVEYPMSGVRQISVNDAVRLDFASGIRSLLRQGPDILLVGEIRDEETATMALRAAMTGHRLFSTLHANSAVAAIPRLMDLGLRPDALAGNLMGILSQRLVRLLRPDCREAYDPDPIERQRLHLPEGVACRLHRVRGDCAGRPDQGYRGRMALVECLAVGASLNALIATGAPLPTLTQAAVEGGYRSLATVARERVLAGLTTLAEVQRVVGLAD
jgi:type II secretory ATPase GspE/PulE/Tfp pilus assembly ATPase PilB-like protein